MRRVGRKPPNHADGRSTTFDNISPAGPAGVSALALAEGYAAFVTVRIHNFWLYLTAMTTPSIASAHGSVPAPPTPDATVRT